MSDYEIPEIIVPPSSGALIQPVHLIEEIDHVLLHISEGRGIEQYTHLFEEQDLPNVKAVIDYLRDHTAEVYLGGAKVKKWLFQGQRDTKDIDLVAVIDDESTRLNLVRTLKESFQKGETVTKNNVTFNLGSRVLDHILYLGMRVDLNINFAPERTPREDQGYGRENSMVISPLTPIDVSIASKESFEDKLCSPSLRMQERMDAAGKESIGLAGFKRPYSVPE